MGTKLKEKYSLNEQALKFILDFERTVTYGTKIENKQLVDIFRQTNFYQPVFDTYIENAVNKAIWYAIKRSSSWDMERGAYTKIFLSDPDRSVYIQFLSEHLYNVLLLKNQIKDEILKAYHLSAKGIGDSLYYLTESYYRQLGTYKGKHSMTDFITPKAIESDQTSKKLVYEHMIPKNVYIKDIVQATKCGELREERIYELLLNYYYVCTVTMEEDKILPSIKMDENWDCKNPFHRYEKMGITFMSNVKRYV